MGAQADGESQVYGGIKCALSFVFISKEVTQKTEEEEIKKREKRNWLSRQNQSKTAITAMVNMP